MRVVIKVTAGPAKGKTFEFDKPDCFLFGRAADARVSLPDDPYVSRHHFLLEIAPPSCKVTDLDSKNGLFINGVRHGGREPPGPGVKQAPGGEKEAYLADGSEVAVGDTRMRVSIEVEATCVQCGRAISAEKRQQLAFVGGTWLCEECRRTAKPAEPVLTPAKRPAAEKREVKCVRCKKDAAEEAGLRGQAAGAEYTCKACRERAAADPHELIEALLRAAVGRKAEAAEPEFKGYRLEKELGRGGMGVVYKAIQEATGRAVAVKTMLPEVAASEESVRTFQREVEVTRQLKHRNIVELIDHGKAGGSFFFVLEFVDGKDLGKLIEDTGRPMDLEEFAPIMMGVLDGLAAAHGARVEMELPDGTKKAFTGIVHRDLKPQNILLAHNGDSWFPKIADFGLSKAFASAGLTDHTVPGQVAGTPTYWPREQITQYKYLHPATDVFSIAAVFYEALTGSRVRDGFEEMLSKCLRRKRQPGIADFMQVIGANPPIPIRKRRRSIPEPVAAVIDRALKEAEMSQDPATMRAQLANLRYADAADFKTALSKALNKAGIEI